MKIVNLSYRSSLQYHNAVAWIDDYRFFYSIWEEVAREHEVVFLEFINEERQIQRNGITYIFQKRGRRRVLFPFALNRFIRDQQPDIVVVHGLMYPLQTYFLRRVLGEKVRIVLQHHAEQPLKGWRYYIQQMTRTVADAYWFTARGMAEPWRNKKLIAQQARVEELMETTSIFHPVDREEAGAVTGVSSGRNYLWVGRLNANKDPLLLLECFIPFVALHPDVKLYMIFHTDDLLQRVKEVLAKHPAIAQAICLIGKVPHEDLLYWYNSCDFIVSCSHYEGSGVAVCEAMSCGCIPLVTDIPSFNYMTQQACGLRFPAGQAPALQKVLEASLLLDVAKEREKTLKQFQENLSPQAIARRIIQLLASL